MKREAIQVARFLALRVLLAVALAGGVALWGGTADNATRAMPLTTVRYVADDHPAGSDGTNTCTNPAAPCLTIQHAVDQAASGDEIRIAEGYYLLAAGQEQIVYLAKSVTLRGGYDTTFSAWDPDTYISELNAGGYGRCIYVTGGAKPLIEGLDIINGNAAGLGGGPSQQYDDAGGGIYVSNAAPTLRHNRISANTAEMGGGVWLSDSSATLVNNVISENEVTNYGGGVGLYRSAARIDGNSINDNEASTGGGISMEYSPCTITANTVSGNQATINGGGIRIVDSAPTLTHNIVTGNTAAGNGGGFSILRNSRAVLTQNTVTGNQATSYGGGLYIQASSNTLNRNEIAGNTAGTGGGLYIYISNDTFNGNEVADNAAGGNGGGIYLSISDATLANTFVLGNQAAGRGSGVYVNGNAPSLLHTTLAGNTGGDGSGIHATNVLTNYSSLTLVNTILVSQTMGITVAAGCTATLQATLWGLNSSDWDNGSDWGGAGTINTAGNIWDDPVFADAAGGDYHLALDLLLQPAIDAGVDSGIGDDVDGQERPHYGGYDLGADEWWPLVAAKTVTPDTVAPGDPLTYTVVLTNASTSDIPAEMSDVLHPYVDFAGPLVYDSGSGGHASGVITWTGTVTAGASVSIAWAVLISESTPSEAVITNTAIITDPYGTFATSSLPVTTGLWFYLPLVRRGF